MARALGGVAHMKSVGYCFKCNDWLTPERARQSGFGKSWFCLIHGTTLRTTARQIREIEPYVGQKLPRRPE